MSKRLHTAFKSSVVRVVTVVVREATVAVGKVMAVTRLLAAVVREVNTVLRVVMVVLEDVTEAAEVRCGSGGLCPPPPPLPPQPLSLCHFLCLNVQVGATHPSPTHPLSGLKVARSIWVDGWCVCSVYQYHVNVLSQLCWVCVLTAFLLYCCRQVQCLLGIQFP